MPVTSIITNNIDISANTVRYSLLATKNNTNFTGTITLKRCSVANDEWIDDPSENSLKTVGIPISMNSAMSSLFQMADSVFAKPHKRVQINTRLKDKKLVVSLTLFPVKAKIQTIPDLEAYLTENPDKAVSVMTCWNTLNEAIGALNIEKELI